MATHAQRRHIVEWLDWCAAHAAGLAYPKGDQRTARDGISWHLTEQETEHRIEAGGKWQGDCSEFGSYTLKIAGLWRFAGPGWTGDHLTWLPDHYTDGKRARAGALVVFGLDHDPNGVHEAVVWEADPGGGDPIVASHGEPGFDKLRVSQFTGPEFAGHTYLSIAHL
jgi:hypothetical protein